MLPQQNHTGNHQPHSRRGNNHRKDRAQPPAAHVVRGLDQCAVDEDQAEQLQQLMLFFTIDERNMGRGMAHAAPMAAMRSTAGSRPQAGARVAGFAFNENDFEKF